MYYGRFGRLPGGICIFFIPGIFIAIATFPGVILHEWSHKFFCDRAGVPVYEVKYFELSNTAGYVRHGEITRYRDILLVTLAPLIVNSIAAVLAFIVPVVLHDGLINYFFFWLGGSFAMHAFPSNQDAGHLWAVAKTRWKESPITLLGLPAVALIGIANVLRFFWFDLLYAFVLWGVTFAVVSTILVGTYSAYGAVAGDSASYSFAKETKIYSRSDGTLTDYQLPFTLHAGSGKDDTDDIYLNDHARSWPNDVRFTDSDDKPLSYWIQSYDGSTARVWVRFPAIPESGTIFRVYYGKFMDHNESNGSATFTLFDDFDTLNTSTWASTQGVAADHGVLTIRSDGKLESMESRQSYGEGYAVLARVKSAHFQDPACLERFGYIGIANRKVQFLAYFSSPLADLNGKYRLCPGGNFPFDAPIKGWTAGQFHDIEINHEGDLRGVNTGSKVECTVDGGNQQSLSHYITADPADIVAMAEGKGSMVEIDWLLVHKTEYYDVMNSGWSKEKWLL